MLPLFFELFVYYAILLSPCCHADAAADIIYYAIAVFHYCHAAYATTISMPYYADAGATLLCYYYYAIIRYCRHIHMIADYDAMLLTPRRHMLPCRL